MSGEIFPRDGWAGGIRHASLSAVPVAVSLVAGLAAGGILVRRPSDGHLLIAVIVVLALWAVSLTSPRAAILITLSALPFLALGRRLLIGYDGWKGTDPLLLIGPAAALAVLLQGRSFRRTRTSSFVLVLLGLSALESVNPLGGTLRAGVVGLLFVAAPLLWFFVGRNFSDRRLVKKVLTSVLLTACLIAAYGLWQVLNGLPSWDAAWLKVGGYAALDVGGTIRPFGTFSSSAEYATYLGAAAAACIALALHRRISVLVLLPLLAPAIFLESSRGIVVLLVATTIVLCGLRTRRPAAAALVMVAAAVLVAVGWRNYAPSSKGSEQQGTGTLIQHQLGGLSHPLDQRQSTLMAHWHLFSNGFRAAFRQPLGIGTGATNLAGSRFGGVTAGTEVDISNTFVGLGILGGVAFVGIIVLTLRRTHALYRARNDPLVFAVLGMLLVTLGQWLNGGYYALSPLIWFLAGWIDREASPLEANPPVSYVTHLRGPSRPRL